MYGDMWGYGGGEMDGQKRRDVSDDSDADESRADEERWRRLTQKPTDRLAQGRVQWAVERVLASLTASPQATMPLR